MGGLQLAELSAFVAVAEHRSFTRAAAQTGVALPTMSHTIRVLEERIGVRLFNRTTRSVALTEAGERLLAEVLPLLEGIEHAVESVNLFREKPQGMLRLAVARAPATILLPSLLPRFLAEYPDIRVEVAIDDTHSDIVSGRFDAGIRFGNRVERDMTVLRLVDAFRMIAVAAPAYVVQHARPAVPDDLRAHNCIRYRMPWDGGLMPWIFARDGQPIEVAVEGSLIVNDIQLLVSATLGGVGVSYIAEPVVAQDLAQGRLVNVLGGWHGNLPGMFLYHPSRHQTPMPLRVFISFVEKWRRRLPAAGTVAVSGV